MRGEGLGGKEERRGDREGQRKEEAHLVMAEVEEGSLRRMH